MTPDSPNIIRFITETNDDNFQKFMRGHLYLEALLGEIIERSFSTPAALDRVAAMFFNKVKLVRALGRLDDREEELLLAVNAVRNKLAHKLEFSLTFETAFALLSKAQAAGVDFSDDGIFDHEWAEKNYGVFGVISEVISNTFQHIVWQNEDLLSEQGIGELLR